MRNKILLILLLLVSMVLLTILVPGGPIETRDFSHISPDILGGFNVFLTSLGMISLVLIYFVWKGYRWAYMVSLLCGLSYFLVYTLDLGRIFPVSPTPMPKTLLIIEVIGTVLSIPLMYSSYLYFKSNSKFEAGDSVIPLYFKILLVVLILVGIGIVIFATNAAMKAK